MTATLPLINRQRIGSNVQEICNSLSDLTDFVASGAGLPYANVTQLVTVPTDGTSDCGPAFQEAYDALLGTGQALYVPPGTFKFISQGINLRYGKAVPIILSPGTVILTALATNVADETGFWLWGEVTNSVVAATTISAAALGATTVVVASATGFAVGGKFFIRSTDTASVAMYQIRTVASTTITLDRPLTRPFPNGSTAQLITSVVEDVQVIGNGALITGACYRYMELDLTWRGLVQDLRFDDSSGDVSTNTLIAFDSGSYMCAVRRVCGVGRGIAMESNDGSVVEGCEFIAKGTQGANLAGIYLSDCTGCEVRGCLAYGWNGANGSGVILTSQGSLGCLDCKVIGGSYVGNSLGINIHAGARNKVALVTANVNTTGINTDASPGTQIVSCTAVNCVGGVSVAASSDGTTIEGLDVSGCTNFGLDCAASVRAHGVYCASGNLNGSTNTIIRATGCEIFVDGFNLSTEGTQSATPGVFFTAASGIIHASHGKIALNGTAGGGQVAFYSVGAGARMHIDDVDVAGSGTNKFLFSTDANAKTRLRGLRYPTAGFSGLTTSGQMSRGQQTLTGGTDSIAFTDLQTADRVRLTLADPNGGTVSFWRVQYTPGTGFSITPSLGTDTSKVDWEIV